jgi:hypothetical protein
VYFMFSFARAKIEEVRIERVEPKIFVIPLKIVGKKINMHRYIQN